MNSHPEVRNQQITKSNDLIECVDTDNPVLQEMSKLSLQGIRFLSFICSYLPKGKGNEPTPGVPYELEIRVKEFADAFGIDPKNAYKIIKDQASKLLKTSTEFIAEDGAEVEVGLLSKRKYHPGEGRVWLRIDEDLLPYYMGLSSNYTPYKLKDVYSFSRPSTYWLYEILKQYKKIGKREILLEDIHALLRLGNKHKRPTTLKDRVIDPAIAEINATSDIKVQYDQKKRGRRIVAFVFHIVENNDTKSTQEKIREKVEKELGKDECIAPEFAKFLREEYHMYPKQAKELANLAGKQDQLEEAKKKLKEIRKRWEKAPDVNPKTGKTKKLGGYCFNALKRELTQRSLFDKS